MVPWSRKDRAVALVDRRAPELSRLWAGLAQARECREPSGGLEAVGGRNAQQDVHQILDGAMRHIRLRVDVLVRGHKTDPGETCKRETCRNSRMTDGTALEVLYPQHRAGRAGPLRRGQADSRSVYPNLS